MSQTAASHAPSSTCERADQEPRPRHARLRDQLLGLEHDRAARGALHRSSWASTASQKALLVATPVLVGSLGRILAGRPDRPVRRPADVPGADRSRPSRSSCSSRSPATPGSYGLMLLFGFFLGIAGTTFAVGIPFVNAWFEADRRGFATGVFGAGHGRHGAVGVLHAAVRARGSATPRRTSSSPSPWSRRPRSAGSSMRNSPRVDARTPTRSCPSSPAALKLPVTWQMSFLYAVAFGGFVAFSTYLPTYLKDVYAFDLTAAGTRTAGFAIAAVVARPIGGILVRPHRSADRRRRSRSPGTAVLAVVARVPAAARAARRH